MRTGEEDWVYTGFGLKTKGVDAALRTLHVIWQVVLCTNYPSRCSFCAELWDSGILPEPSGTIRDKISGGHKLNSNRFQQWSSFFCHLIPKANVPAKVVSDSLYYYLFLILTVASACIHSFAYDSNQEVTSVSISNPWHSNKNILYIHLIISFSKVTTQVTSVYHSHLSPVLISLLSGWPSWFHFYSFLGHSGTHNRQKDSANHKVSLHCYPV